jgi:hypothetical protein
MPRLLVVALIALLPTLAEAAPEKGGGKGKGKDTGFDPVWSVGGHLGSMILPGAYPIGFPPKINNQDFDDVEGADDLDGDGVAEETTIEKVRGDFLFGADAFYWLNSAARIGLTLDVDLGTNFSHLQAIFLVDGTADTGSLFVVYGGGAGFGQTTFRGEDDDERLSIPNFPLRGEAGILIPATDQFGIEPRLFLQMNVPSRHAYTDVTGAEQDVRGVPVSYVTLGLQIGAAFGEYD